MKKAGKMCEKGGENVGKRRGKVGKRRGKCGKNSNRRKKGNSEQNRVEQIYTQKYLFATAKIHLTECCGFMRHVVERRGKTKENCLINVASVCFKKRDNMCVKNSDLEQIS